MEDRIQDLQEEIERYQLALESHGCMPADEWRVEEEIARMRSNLRRLKAGMIPDHWQEDQQFTRSARATTPERERSVGMPTKTNKTNKTNKTTPVQESKEERRDAAFKALGHLYREILKQSGGLPSSVDHFLPFLSAARAVGLGYSYDGSAVAEEKEPKAEQPSQKDGGLLSLLKDMAGLDGYATAATTTSKTRDPARWLADSLGSATPKQGAWYLDADLINRLADTAEQVLQEETGDGTASRRSPLNRSLRNLRGQGWSGPDFIGKPGRLIAWYKAHRAAISAGKATPEGETPGPIPMFSGHLNAQAKLLLAVGVLAVPAAGGVFLLPGCIPHRIAAATPDFTWDAARHAARHAKAGLTWAGPEDYGLSSHNTEIVQARAGGAPVPAGKPYSVASAIKTRRAVGAAGGRDAMLAWGAPRDDAGTVRLPRGLRGYARMIGGCSLREWSFRAMMAAPLLPGEAETIA